MNQSIRVLEHEELLIDREPSAATLTVVEADRLARIAEGRPGFCSRGVGRVRFAQYAGIVNLGHRTLEILPKVDTIEASEENCRGILLRLLRLSEDLRIAETGEARQATRRMPLLDVFISAFFDEVVDLVRGGLLRRYQVCEENLPVLRGRLLINRQVVANALRVDRLACRYDELTPDNDWNRVLKAALKLIRSSISSMALRRRWAELWPAFDEVGELVKVSEVFARLSPDRQVNRYRAAIMWARWIVKVLSPSLRAGKDGAPGFLIDTNQLFERAVARHLRRRVAVCAPVLQVESQNNDKFLAEVSTAPTEDMIGLRPDLVIRSNRKLELIADTKWKCVGVTAKGHLAPDTADVHQMLAYAAAFGCDQLALIYPWHEGLGGARETTLHLPIVGDVRPQLHIVVLDVGCDGLPLRLGSTANVVSRLLEWRPGFAHT